MARKMSLAATAVVAAVAFGCGSLPDVDRGVAAAGRSSSRVTSLDITSRQPAFGTRVSCGQTSIRTPPSGGGSSPTRCAAAKPLDPGAPAPGAWYIVAVEPPASDELVAEAVAG